MNIAIETYLCGLCGITVIGPETKRAKTNNIYMRQRFRGAIDYQLEHWKGELDSLIETGWGQFIVNKQGKGQSLDRLAQEAAEEGYIRPGENVTPDNFIKGLYENRQSIENLEGIEIIEKLMDHSHKVNMTLR